MKKGEGLFRKTNLVFARLGNSRVSTKEIAETNAQKRPSLTS